MVLFMVALNKDTYESLMLDSAERRYDYRGPLATGEWADWRKGFRQELEEILGLPIIRKKTLSLELEPRLEFREERDQFILEKLLIRTEPGIDIPFYLLLPKQAAGPLPLVLTPHGHGRRGKEVYIGNYESEEERRSGAGGERDIALQAVAEGYAVIAPDVRAFWEMSLDSDREAGLSSCHTLQRRAIMYGRTLIGERVHDMGRLIDYAMTRPEIDASRIAITGNSGGGTVSLFTAALDDRIKVAAPASYFCTFADSVIGLHHCLCNLVPGVMNLGEMYDIAGLIAPKPVLMITGALDDIFPLSGTQKAFGHLQRIYEANGAASQCELYIGEGGHRYYKTRVWSFIREKFAAMEK
jgi:dienelactone hydrolase